MNIPFFAITHYGLEEIGAREVSALPGVTLDSTRYRLLHLHAQEAAVLLQLRTVDDIFFRLAQWDAVSTTRPELHAIRAGSSRLPLDVAVRVCSELRDLPSKPHFSVTASFVGKRKYTSDDIKQAVAEGINERWGWRYEVDDRDADVNIRVFIEHNYAAIGMRLAQRPLHERDYKQVHTPGSLAPTVAAAMLALADIEPRMRLLDPCCGAGTIVIEAGLSGAQAVGGDIDPMVLGAAQSNAAKAGILATFEQWDARALPLTDQSFERIVCNMPWDRQVETEDIAEFYAATLAEMQRVLTPGGKVVLLSGLPEHIEAFPAFHAEQQLVISLFGQRPTIFVGTFAPL